MIDKLIAIVDDEPGIIQTISEYLVNKGFMIKSFGDAEALFTFLNKGKPDLIILDLMLPGGIHGFDICRKLKKHDRFSDVPIIILSANSEEGDKVSGLELGADDYMVKPFSLKELDARIRAVLRRNDQREESKIISVGDMLVIDQGKYEIKVNGKKVELTPAEFKILELLASRVSQVFTRERMLGYLWGDEKIVVERTIDVHIKHLREKLGKAGEYIQNVRGIGYKFEVE